MRRSLFAHFRGIDGRSLTRALACLILINAFFAGLLSGAATAASPESAICTVAMPGLDAAPNTDAPAPGHALDCCPGLCSAIGAALPPGAPALTLPAREGARVALAPAVLQSAPVDHANPARAPPVLA